MEDNNKLFVFEKKEVALIFIFIILIAIISFTLGVRTGKTLSLKHDDYSSEDIKSIDLKSVEEEDVSSSAQGSDSFEGSLNEVSESPQDPKDVELRLKEEMKKLADDKTEVPAPAKEINEEDSRPVVSVPAQVENSNVDVYNQKNDYKGKFTIQLYADQSKASAQDFADGFILKGYDVIVNEVIIAGKGQWYRVSIGVFDTVNEAKDYLQKEQSLFQGKKYIINQF